jgi:hypothetical protein
LPVGKIAEVLAASSQDQRRNSAAGVNVAADLSFTLGD